MLRHYGLVPMGNGSHYYIDLDKANNALSHVPKWALKDLVAAAKSQASAATSITNKLDLMRTESYLKKFL